ncbi:MAG: hypothetical protein RTU63_04250 [Candidatus Thorarchaeota archaeon]
MYNTKPITKMLSMFALVLFSLSLFMTPPVAEISPGESIIESISYTMNNSRTLADYPENFTQVEWDLGTVSEQHNNTWTSNHYRFGPTINWHTRFPNGSWLGWQDEIAINQDADFIIEIPYSSLGGQTPAGLYIMGSYFNMSALQESEGKFDRGPMSSIAWIAWYNITGDFWWFYSSMNATMDQKDIPEDISSLEDVFGPPVEPFMEMDALNSHFDNETEAYWATVRLRFNSTVLGGFYTIECGV